MDGVLLVDKPAGITSYGVVDRIKKKFSLKKVGHGGSLDPLATGLLVLLVGKATKLASGFLSGDKEYEASVLLGRVTDSQDISGKIIRQTPGFQVTRVEVEAALRHFRGEIEQVPPMFSALKYRGKRLYELARRGLEVPRPPRKVKIKQLELREFKSPYFRIKVACSKGTYIRTLAHDLGEALGLGGCLAELRRTAAGPFRVEDARTLAEILAGERRELAALILPLPYSRI